MQITICYERSSTLVLPDWPTELLNILADCLESNVVPSIQVCKDKYIGIGNTFIQLMDQYVENHSTIVNRVALLNTRLPTDRESFLFWLLKQDKINVLVVESPTYYDDGDDPRLEIIAVLNNIIYSSNSEVIDLPGPLIQQYTRLLQCKIYPEGFLAEVCINHPDVRGIIQYQLSSTLHSDSIYFDPVDVIGTQSNQIIPVITDDYVLISQRPGSTYGSDYIRTSIYSREVWNALEEYLINNWNRVIQLCHTRGIPYDSTSNDHIRWNLEWIKSRLSTVLTGLE